MKTSEHVKRWRENHHKALEALRGPDCHLSGIQLWRKLRRMENVAHTAATKYCNGEIDDYTFEQVKDRTVEQINIMFGRIVVGLFVNGDPRGYALKLEPSSKPTGMHRDWGDYGILAAEINDD